MIRAGNLWPAICNPDALYRAYLQARRGKRGNHACNNFERRLGSQLESLHDTLANGSYRPKDANKFWVYEPKPRLIEAPAFRDLVVQHALYAVVMPIFERKFLPTNFACRIGLGTHKAADYVQHMLRQARPGQVVLKVDCRRFFYSLDHQVLKAEFRRHIKCARTLELLDMFVDRPEGIGVPIGNLMSQIYGLLYLNPLDQFIKRELKARLYARYVDDMVILCDSPEQAQQRLAAISTFMRDRLRLEVSKFSITPVQRGVNAFGYRTWASRRYIRKRSLYIATRRLRAGEMRGFVSCLGHARHTSSIRHLIQLAEDHHALGQLPQAFRSIHHLRAAHRPAAKTPGAGDD